MPASPGDDELRHLTRDELRRFHEAAGRDHDHQAVMAGYRERLRRLREGQPKTPSSQDQRPLELEGQADEDARHAEQAAESWLNTLLPADALFMYFFGRPPITESDHQAKEHFTAALLGALRDEMGRGTDPRDFLFNFRRRLGNFPPAVDLYPSGQEIADAYDRFAAILGDTLTAQMYASMQYSFHGANAGVQITAKNATQPATRTKSSGIIGINTQTQEAVTLKNKHRTRHVSIIGRTGYGKTTLLEHLILEDLRSGTSAIVIDPHGDLSQRIISLASDAQRRRITLLELWPTRPFRLNLLECADPTQLDRTVDDILTVFHRLFDTGDVQLGHRLHRYFGNALRTLIPNGGTLADVQRLFADDAFRREMLRGVSNRKVHEFWQLYDQIPDRERFNQLESTINRLDEFLSSETALAMVSAAHTTVPFNALDQDGQLLLIRIPVGELGELQARFYGSLFLSLLTDRLFARASLPKPQRHRLHLYLDEYGWFATGTTAALLQQARKYNLGATIAFQTLADLPDEKNKEAALQVGSFLVLRLTGQDADELASAFPVIPTRETIEENIGFRKITSLTPNPVVHLLENPHNNRLANTAADAFLRPLRDEAEGKVRRPWDNTDNLFTLPPPDREKLQEIIRFINGFLVTVMDQKQDITNDAIASIAADVFIKLTLVFYYPFPAWARGIMKKSSPFKIALATWLSLAAKAEDPTDYFSQADDLPWNLLIKAEHGRLTEIAADTLQRPDIAYKLLETTAHKQTRAWLTEEKQKIVAEIRQALTKLEADAAALITLCRVLAAEPILVPTGQEREEFRGRVHLQTFADARIEFAGILANLKEYTAYYQMGSTHGQVALAEPLEPAELDEEAIEAVRERSKSLYGVPLEPLEEDTPPDLSGQPWSPPRPPGPRISRRSPRREQ